MWQWALFLIALPLTYLAALVPTWIAGLLVRRRETEISRKFSVWITGPIRIVLWILFIRATASYIGVSATGRSLFRKEGIQFAFPTSTTYLTQDDEQPLHISLANTHELPVGE